MRLLVEPPRTTREYETIFILQPDALDDEKSRVTDRVEEIIDRLEGHVLKKDEWGKRKLAYDIQKQSHGIYYFYQYLGYGDLVGELERNLRILEPVMKYLTIKVDEDIDREERINRPDKPKPEQRDVHLDMDDDDEDEDDYDDEDEE